MASNGVTDKYDEAATPTPRAGHQFRPPRLPLRTTQQLEISPGTKADESKMNARLLQLSSSKPKAPQTPVSRTPGRNRIDLQITERLFTSDSSVYSTPVAPERPSSTSNLVDQTYRISTPRLDRHLHPHIFDPLSPGPGLQQLHPIEPARRRVWEASAMMTEDERQEKQLAALSAWANTLLQSETFFSEVDLGTTKQEAKSRLQEMLTNPNPQQNSARMQRVTRSKYADFILQEKCKDFIRRGASVFTSTDSSEKLRKLVEGKKIRIRDGIDVFANLGVQTSLLGLLFSFHPFWLYVGLETVHQHQVAGVGKPEIPMGESNVLHALARFILHHIFACKEVFSVKKFAYGNVKKIATPAGREKLHEVFLTRILSLMYLLEQAKASHLFSGTPRLFTRASPFKSVKSICEELDRLIIAASSQTIVKSMATCGVKLVYNQSFIEDYDFNVASLKDFGDGIIVAKLVEVISDRPGSVLSSMRDPKGDLIRKKRNVEKALKAAVECGMDVKNVSVNAVVSCKREEILELLWRMVGVYVTVRDDERLRRESLAVCQGLSLPEDQDMAINIFVGIGVRIGVQVSSWNDIRDGRILEAVWNTYSKPSPPLSSYDGQTLLERIASAAETDLGVSRELLDLSDDRSFGLWCHLFLQRLFSIHDHYLATSTPNPSEGSSFADASENTPIRFVPPKEGDQENEAEKTERLVKEADEKIEEVTSQLHLASLVDALPQPSSPGVRELIERFEPSYTNHGLLKKEGPREEPASILSTDYIEMEKLEEESVENEEEMKLSLAATRIQSWYRQKRQEKIYRAERERIDQERVQKEKALEEEKILKEEERAREEEEKQRLAEEQAKKEQEEEMERIRAEEEKRLAEEQAKKEQEEDLERIRAQEEKRLAEEQAKKEQEEEMERIRAEEEKRLAEEQAKKEQEEEMERIRAEEEKRLAEEQAKKEQEEEMERIRAEEEKRLAEEQAKKEQEEEMERIRAEEEKRLAEEQAKKEQEEEEIVKRQLAAIKIQAWYRGQKQRLQQKRREFEEEQTKAREEEEKCRLEEQERQTKEAEERQRQEEERERLKKEEDERHRQEEEWRQREAQEEERLRQEEEEQKRMTETKRTKAVKAIQCWWRAARLRRKVRSASIFVCSLRTGGQATLSPVTSPEIGEISRDEAATAGIGALSSHSPLSSHSRHQSEESSDVNETNSEVAPASVAAPPANEIASISRRQDILEAVLMERKQQKAARTIQAWYRGVRVRHAMASDLSARGEFLAAYVREAAVQVPDPEVRALPAAGRIQYALTALSSGQFYSMKYGAFTLLRLCRLSRQFTDQVAVEAFALLFDIINGSDRGPCFVNTFPILLELALFILQNAKEEDRAAVSHLGVDCIQQAFHIAFAHYKSPVIALLALQIISEAKDKILPHDKLAKAFTKRDFYVTQLEQKWKKLPAEDELRVQLEKIKAVLVE